MHGLLGTGHVETLASKAGGIDICLRGDHDRIGRRNVFRREMIFCPNRSLRLNLDRVTKRLGAFSRAAAAMNVWANASRKR